MENASKALIIAGAILIAILLISVGIVVMNSVNKPVSEVSKEGNSQAVQMFNSKIQLYGGNNKTAQELKSLCMVVQSSNTADPSHQILLRYKVNTTAYETKSASEVISLLNDGNTYNIIIHYTKEFKNNSFYDDQATALNLTSAGIKTEIGYISVININPYTN